MFKIGEKVGLLYETGHGIIRAIRANGLFLVEDDGGFERILHHQLPVTGGESAE